MPEPTPAEMADAMGLPASSLSDPAFEAALQAANVLPDEGVVEEVIPAQPPPGEEPGVEPAAEPEVSEARSLFERVISSTSDRGAPPAEDALRAKDAELSEMRRLLGSVANLLDQRNELATRRIESAGTPPTAAAADFERELSDPRVIAGFKKTLEEEPEKLPFVLGKLAEYVTNQRIAKELAPIKEALNGFSQANAQAQSANAITQNFATAAKYVEERGTGLEKEVLRDFIERKGDSVLHRLVMENPLYVVSPQNFVSAITASAGWVEKAGGQLGASPAPSGTAPIQGSSTGPGSSASLRMVAARAAQGKPKEEDIGASILGAKPRTAALPFLSSTF